MENPDFVDRIQEIFLNIFEKYQEQHGTWCGCSLHFRGLGNDQRSLRVTEAYCSVSDSYIKKGSGVAHRFGKPVFKHTDGNIWTIFDLIIEIGIDGIHPIDSVSGMDFGEAKQKYGKKLCLMGNVNCSPTLIWKSVEEVRQEVKECMKKAGYGGGYICVSSNSIHSGVNPENFVAMDKAITEFGRYPPELD